MRLHDADDLEFPAERVGQTSAQRVSREESIREQIVDHDDALAAHAIAPVERPAGPHRNLHRLEIALRHDVDDELHVFAGPRLIPGDPETAT